jgi:predicted ATPase/DNA-binding SARP family transcriptional activator/DNA-binding CsgD family transcriptional regulator
MDLLWPESGKKAASNNLRQTLLAARRALTSDPAEGSRYLASEDESLVLCPEGELWVDVDAFEEVAATARRARDPGAYRAAIDLYSGELLPADRYEEWAEERRETLRQTHLRLLLELAKLYEERREIGPAIKTLGEALRQAPTDEQAHASLMRLYALSGRKAEALTQYGRLEEVLAGELDTEPAATSQALREEIASGRFLFERQEKEDGATLSETPTGIGSHNLPAPRSSFVGREREMLELKRALAMTRLLTLTGVGGSGKTRLALKVARDLVGAYPDGVWMVEFASLSEGTLVPQAVANSVGVPEQPGRSLTNTLVDDLREKRLLLVLDNCEHLAEAAARLSDMLLSSCPHLRILATSRETLGVKGELMWRVDPLSVPDANRDDYRGFVRAPSAEELARYEAVRLFVERARLRSPHFELTKENAGAVAQICRHLEGIPLAVELAAARVGTLAVVQIAERLENSLKLLRGGRSAPQRQRTLRATLEWSYNLLSEEEQVLLRRLSAFAGGWTLEAAEAVGAGDPVQEEDIIALISMLVDKSLVVEGRAEEAGRYRLLEPVRQYAGECLEESGEADAFRRRHAAFFLALAEDAEPELTGAQQQEWANRLEAENDNMRAALSWSLEREPETALRLAVVLARFWEIRARFVEGSEWLEAALRQGDRFDAAMRVKLLSEAGTFAFYRADFDHAIVLHGEALELYREVGDDNGVAFALLCLGAQYAEKGDYERAAPFLEEGLVVSRRSGNIRNIAGTLHNLAEVERQRGNYERAKALGMESIALAREMEDKRQLAAVVGWVGLLTVFGVEEHDLAERSLKEALTLDRELGNWAYGAYCLEGFAGLAGARGQGARAARLWGAAEALRTNIGTPLPLDSRLLFERSVAAARALLDEEAWESAFVQGMAMSAEEAAEYALSEKDPSERLPADEETDEPLTTDPLTAREREVAAMVAQGLSNRQIARELFLSERTIEVHVSKILRKLELTSRTEIAAWATEQRLIAPNS